MSWLLVIVSGLFETGWAYGLKASDGFTRPIPTVLTVLGMLASFVLLSIAVKTLPIGTAYAVWVGIGAIGTAILGMMLLGDPVTIPRLASLGLVLAGVIGLKLSS